GSAAWRSASPPCSSPSLPPTAVMPSRPAATPSTRSSARCPSGRRSTSRTARSGWACREAELGLLPTVERSLRRHAMLAGGETVLVAVSGGADSGEVLVTLDDPHHP